MIRRGVRTLPARRRWCPLIEVDFLFGSQQRELQRTGRLMRAEHPESHDIIMTGVETQKYGKRLWMLQEKGLTVKIAA